jgi:hypothetical protein
MGKVEMKTNTKTSLKITMNTECGASVDLKWSDRDVENKAKCSEMIICELVTIPDYQWLAKLTSPYLAEKYCSHCIYRLDMNSPCRDEDNKDVTPFPYCFKNKDEAK